MDGSTQYTYLTEAKRQESLKDLQHLSPSKRNAIARSGFYQPITGSLRCVYCGCRIADWSEDDDPWAEHAQISPRCIHVISCKGRQYVHQQLTNTASAVAIMEPQTCGHDLGLVTPAHHEALQLYGISKTFQVQHHSAVGTSQTRDKWQYVTPNGVTEVPPRNTNMAEYKQRYDSIRSNLRSNLPPADKMADTGLYMDEGVVKCFHCGESFFDWRSDEDPLQRHVAQAAMCWHVIQTVGEDNIDSQSPTVQSKAKDDIKQVKKNESVENMSSDSESEDLSDLLAENERLKERLMCKICLDNSISIVFLPCGHIVCCQQCCPALSKCPICRKCVKGYVKAFFAEL